MLSILWNFTEPFQLREGTIFRLCVVALKLYSTLTVWWGTYLIQKTVSPWALIFVSSGFLTVQFSVFPSSCLAFPKKSLQNNKTTENTQIIFYQSHKQKIKMPELQYFWKFCLWNTEDTYSYSILLSALRCSCLSKMLFENHPNNFGFNNKPVEYQRIKPRRITKYM